VSMRSSLFRNVSLKGSYRHFGTTYWFNRQGCFIANGTDRLSRKVGNKLSIDAA